MAGPWIALLTDFGTQDAYVGVLKGVLAAQSPQARLIDLSHHVPPGDVTAGAFMLWQAAPYFPAGTVYLAVVDPGVGSERRGIAAVWPDKLFVGPDNGLISYWLANQAPSAAHQLSSPPEPASHTFHGRDMFAPAAAQLVSGTPVEQLGPTAGELVRLPNPRLSVDDPDQVRGELLHCDAFGNWLTSIGGLTHSHGRLSLRPWLGGDPVDLSVGEAVVRLPDGTELVLQRTFSDVPEGAALAYIGSSGLVEIGVNRGSAADALQLEPGQTVELIVKG